MAAFETRAASYASRVERALDARLPAASEKPQSLHQAMRHALLGGGKRMRPLLCYATGETIGVPAAALDDAACAVELVHAFSLVHDDLPAMDDDDLRRGRPSTHKAYGVATAILAGDALQTLAFGVLAGTGDAPPQRLRMLRTLSEATGSLGMTGGQVMDLEAEGLKLADADLEELDRRKTGCLIRASVMLACHAQPRLDNASSAALEQFANAIGLAFQIRDDLLDVQGETTVIGKQHGADAAHGKSTWPALLGVTAAERRADALYAEALQALQSFGEAAEPLRWMASRLVHRDR